VQRFGQLLPSFCTVFKAGCAYCSATQEGSKAQPKAKAQKGSQASQAKGKPDYDKAGPLADWLKDAAAEMKKQGVNQKFTVSFAFMQHSIVFVAPVMLSMHAVIPSGNTTTTHDKR